MTVEFTLKSLLLTGHCFDGTAKEPPRGMQLQLRESEMTSLSGTIVMSNLGYFQLQAAPGVWELSLAPGRSRDVYQMEYISNLDRSELQGEEEEDAESEDSMEVTSEGAIDENGTSTRIALSDFSGRTVRLRVRKREGQEDDDVLHDGTSTGAQKSG
jgi:UDP-glucose:glycoprotein glucosyltransferase